MQDICWGNVLEINTCGKEGWRRKQDWEEEKLSRNAILRKSPLSLKDALELGGSSELFKLSQGDRLLYLS